MLSRPLLSPSPLAFNLPGVRVFSKGSTYYYRRWRRASWKEWPLSSVNENETFVPEGDEGSGVCLCVYSPWSVRKGVPARGNSDVLRPGESRASSEPCEQLGIFEGGISVQFSCSVVSDFLRPHGLQHARLPCPPPTPGACSNLCPSR